MGDREPDVLHASRGESLATPRTEEAPPGQPAPSSPPNEAERSQPQPDAPASIQQSKLLAGVPCALFSARRKPDGRLKFVLCNAAMASLFRCSVDELCAAEDGLALLEASIFPKDRGLLHHSSRQALSDQTPWHCTFRLQHGDAAPRWVEGRATRDEHEDDLWHGMILAARERVPEIAPQNEIPDHNAALLQATAEALFLHGDGGVIKQVNNAATQLLGYSAEELIGKTPLLFDPKFPAKLSTHRLRERLLCGEAVTFETLHVRKDGSRIPVEVRMSAFQAGEHFLAVSAVRDLSQRRRERVALQESERRFRQLSDLLPGIVWWMGGNSSLAFVSSRGQEYAALAMDGSVDLSRLVHPDDLLQIRRRFDEANQQCHPFRSELRVRGATSDSYRWFLAHCVPSINERGQISEWLGLAIDIDDLKRTEAALRAQRDRFETLASVAPAVLHSFRLYPDGRIEYPYISPNMQSLLGFNPQEVTHQALQPADVIHPEDLPRVRRTLRDAARRLSAWRCEYRVRHPQRGEIWLETYAAPVAEPGGSTLWHGMLFDVTDRVRAAESLQESNRRYQQLADAQQQIVWTANPAGDVDFFNAHALAYSGKSLEELLSWGWLDMIHPDDRDAVMTTWSKIRREGSGAEISKRLRRADGTYRWHVSSQVPTRDAQGNIQKWIGTCTDIHEIKLYEEALRQERDRFQHLVHAVPGVIFSFLLRPDGHTSFPFLSPQAAELYGVDVKALSHDTSSLLQHIHPKDLRRAQILMLRSAKTLGVWRMSMRIQHHQKREVWVGSLAIPSRQADGSILWHGFLADVTASRQAERARQHENLILRLLSDAAAALLKGGATPQLIRNLCSTVAQHVGCEVICHYTLDAGRLHASISEGFPRDALAALERLDLGDQLCGACAQNRAELYVPDLQATTEARAQAARSLGLRVYVCNPLIDGDRLLGTLAFASRRKDSLNEAERGLIATFSHYVAIAEARMVSEQALRDSEERSRRLLNQLPVAVSVSVNHKIALCNPAFVRLLGARDESELIGRGAFQIVHPDYHPFLRARIARSKAGETTLPGAEHLITRVDGQSVPVYSEVTTTQLDNQQAVLVVYSDLTERENARAERQRLEEQLRQQAKMEALGRLAGGVAHDFNNLLTVIQGYSDLLLSRTVPKAMQQEALTGIQEAGERAARLTQQLLALSRKAMVEPKILDLNTVVQENVKLLRRLIREDISLETKLDPDLLRIRADAGQLDQVIMNLVVNARDAMPNGGRLSLQTKNVDVQPGELAQYPNLQAGPHVRLTAADNGIGIRSEILGLIFDPFFTTKPLGEGTGLGLAVVQGIVQQAGGHIRVHSEPGQGTTFVLLFPALRAPSSKPSDAPSQSADRGTETVLLVEDDENVRKIASVSLSLYGYRVLEAEDGEHALDIFEDETRPIDLLITDLVLPGVSGHVLVATLRQRVRGLRALYMSGYSDDSVLALRELGPNDAFIQKPFTPQQLAHRVRSLLDAKPT